jgi:hypothetical protein
VAQCVWWLASIIGLERGLTIHIDNLKQRSNIRQQAEIPLGQKASELGQLFEQVHPNRVSRIVGVRSVSSVPRDLTED